MNDTPPRRSRRSTPPPQRTSLPFVPIFIGIIVLGFIIGAGLSLAGKRGGGERSVVANVAPTRSASPARARTLPPVTPAPTGAPTPTDAPPTDTATSKPSAAPPSAAPAPSASATHAPAKHAAAAHAPITPAPASAAPATAAAASAAPVSPKATAIAGQAAKTGRPHIAAIPVAAPPATTPIATQTAAKADAPASGDDADSEFAKLAATVVRQYVAAIERGDDATAYAAFGPGAAGNVKLLESGTLDGSTRIQHVEARGAGSNATVNVDLKTAKGLYFGQYTVHRTESGAALITDHALNRL